MSRVLSHWCLLGTACVALESTPVADSLPAEFDGTFHVESWYNINVEIAADGTFAWTIRACDFVGGDEGVWALAGEGLDLLPATGATFQWPQPPYSSIDAVLERVRVKPTDDGVRTVAHPIKGATFAQDWVAGENELDCEGYTGP